MGDDCCNGKTIKFVPKSDSNVGCHIIHIVDPLVLGAQLEILFVGSLTLYPLQVTTFNITLIYNMLIASGSLGFPISPCSLLDIFQRHLGKFAILVHAEAAAATCARVREVTGDSTASLF